MKSDFHWSFRSSSAPARTTLVGFAGLWIGASVLGAACGSEAGGAPTAEPASAATPPPPPAPAEPTAPEQACFAVINVAWQGAPRAPETVTRTEAEARQRAEELLARIEAGADFAVLARAESDARTSAERGGLVGTYAQGEWPEPLEAIRDPVFALAVGETSTVLEAPFGWVIARRCPTELVHTRHVLIRYAGARNAGSEITRTREEAHAAATAVLAEVRGGADFASIARERSEDGSAERGGDMGFVGRGRFEPEYERAAFEAEAGDIVGPVESAFGFHVIERID